MLLRSLPVDGLLLQIRPEKNVAPYGRSKTMAEQAAWDFLKTLPVEKVRQRQWSINTQCSGAYSSPPRSGNAPAPAAAPAAI